MVRTHRRLQAALVTLAALTAHAQNYELVYKSTSSNNSSQPAEYVCTFYNKWTAVRHPNAYPSNPGWSESIAIVHSANYNLFQTGTVAGDGVASLASSGDPGALFFDIVTANVVTDTSTASSFSLSNKTTARIGGLEFTSSSPLLSFVSKITPSPDWVAGFTNLNLRDSSTNTWLSEVVVDMYPFDVGVLDGETYTEKGSLTSATIIRFNQNTVPQSSQVFLSPDGSEVLPVARLRCLLGGVEPPRSPTSKPTTPPGNAPQPTRFPVAPTDFPAVKPSVQPVVASTTATPTVPAESDVLLPTLGPTGTSGSPAPILAPPTTSIPTIPAPIAMDIGSSATPVATAAPVTSDTPSFVPSDIVSSDPSVGIVDPGPSVQPAAIPQSPTTGTNVTSTPTLTPGADVPVAPSPPPVTNIPTSQPPVSVEATPSATPVTEAPVTAAPSRAPFTPTPVDATVVIVVPTIPVPTVPPTLGPTEPPVAPPEPTEVPTPSTPKPTFDFPNDSTPRPTRTESPTLASEASVSTSSSTGLRTSLAVLTSCVSLLAICMF